MKTPMQKLIDKLKVYQSEAVAKSDPYTNSEAALFNKVITEAELLLPEEQEVIETAYGDGCHKCKQWTGRKHYYNQKFGSDDKRTIS